MGLIIYDLNQLYRRTFGGQPYRVPEDNENIPVDGKILSDLGNLLETNEHLGKPIWLPVKFVNLNPDVFGASEVFLPYTVIEASVKKTIIKTPLADRKGTVKEVYNIDDYVISLKGFVIDEDKRQWPEAEITVLKKLVELNEAVQLDNALTNIFLDKDTRVVIEELQLPPVEGGGKHIRPFSFKLESDSVFTLEQDV